MKSFSFLDLQFLVSELKFLENERIDSFYLNGEVFYMKIYVKNKGNFYLTNKVSKFLYLDTQKEETENSNGFVIYLRKFLANGYIRKIETIAGERILKIDIERKVENVSYKYVLVFEIFANGNILLLDDKNVIKNLLFTKSFKDRVLKIGESYEFPPQKELLLFDLDKKKFEKNLKESDLEIVKFLAIKFGIGGKYSEEFCQKFEISKTKLAKELTKTEIDLIVKGITKFVGQKLSPQILEKDKKVEDFFPFPFVTCESEGLVQVEDFNSALKRYFSQYLLEEDKTSQEFESALKSLQKRLETQEEQREEANKDYETNNSLGNKIYENYALIEELLSGIKKLLKEKGEKEVLEIIKSNPKLSKLVKKIDFKNQEILVNFE